MTYTEYKIQYREVPPDTSSVLGCLPKLIMLVAIVAMAYLFTWVIMFIISKT